MKQITYIICIVILAATAPADEACDKERVFDELLVYFHDWKIAKRDYHNKFMGTHWKALPSKGRAHYRIRVVAMVYDSCELKVKISYQSCSWAGSASDPKCNPIEYSMIVKTAKFSKLARDAVEFTDELRAGLSQIAPIIPE